MTDEADSIPSPELILAMDLLVEEFGEPDGEYGFFRMVPDASVVIGRILEKVQNMDAVATAWHLYTTPGLYGDLALDEVPASTSPGEALIAFGFALADYMGEQDEGNADG